MKIRHVLTVVALCLPGFTRADALEFGLGKTLNNTNTRLPGYAGSLHARIGWLEAGYTRMGASQLGEDAAISTVGATYQAKRARFGLALISGASYSAAVWWDSANPHPCGVEGCGKRYANDGRHFSRACHLCGAVISAEYALPHGFGLRAEYYGLRHMTPTFQGLIVQATYTIGAP